MPPPREDSPRMTPPALIAISLRYVFAPVSVPPLAWMDRTRAGSFMLEVVAMR